MLADPAVGSAGDGVVRGGGIERITEWIVIKAPCFGAGGIGRDEDVAMDVGEGVGEFLERGVALPCTSRTIPFYP